MRFDDRQDLSPSGSIFALGANSMEEEAQDLVVFGLLGHNSCGSATRKWVGSGQTPEIPYASPNSA
jgi:hypothetical protein